MPLLRLLLVKHVLRYLVRRLVVWQSQLHFVSLICTFVNDLLVRARPSQLGFVLPFLFCFVVDVYLLKLHEVWQLSACLQHVF